MSIYGKAVLLGLVMGPVGALIAVALTALGCPKETALAAAIGVVGASMGTVVMKRIRSE